MFQGDSGAVRWRAKCRIETVLREHLPETLLALALTWVLTAAIVVVILFTPTYLQQVFHVPAHYALQANTGATDRVVASIVGWRPGLGRATEPRPRSAAKVIAIVDFSACPRSAAAPPILLFVARRARLR